MNKIYFLPFLCLSLLSITAFAQTRTIRGVVSSTQGPLDGISIVEKARPENGVTTNVDGNYSITVPASNSVLVVSGVGYLTREFPVGSANTINMTLELDTRGLEEVVVVGYGTQKKINVTASIASIKREEILETPSTSIQNVLAGRLTGFFSQQRGGQPGRDGADIFVRGVSTYNGDQSPLILIDDIEATYSDFSNIDPNEVESISILKDAAATAVYGVKGANGVILVTTRRGLEGAPKVNLRTEFGMQVPTHTPKFLDAAKTAILFNEGLKNEAAMKGTTYVPFFSEEDIELYRNGNDPYGHPNNDWYKTLIRPSAPMTTNNIDISGGSNRVKYFASLGYVYQGGLLRHIQAEGDLDNNYRFNRYNFRSNIDINATKSLSFKLDLSGNSTVINTPNFTGPGASGETQVFWEIYNYEALNPYIYPIYNPDGSFGFTNPNMPQPAFNNIVGRIFYGGYNRQLQNLVNGAVSAIQKLDAITPGLQLKALISVVNANSATRGITRANFPSYYYNSADQVYTPRDVNIFRVSPYNAVYFGNNPRRQTTAQVSLNYDKTIASHTINALILYNQNSKVLARSDRTANYIPVNFRGYTSRVSYNYDNRYMAEFNGSYNGTTSFDENHRWGFFPAGSVGWNIGEERFAKENLAFLSQLKLRGSWGIVGNDNIGAAQNAYIESYNSASNAYSFGQTHGWFSAISPGVLGNTNVTWEKEQKTNIGVDFGFFKGKLTGAVDVFSNLRYDILTARNTIPSFFGFVSDNLPPENIGKVSNKGYELELGYNGRLAKNLRLNMRGTFSYAKNKILEIDEVPQPYPWKVQTGTSIGQIQQFIWDGFYTAEEALDPAVPKYSGQENSTLPGFLKYRDVNGDGVIGNFEDQGFFGKSNLPTTVLGLRTNLSYKRLSFNIFLQSALDFDVQVDPNLVAPFKGNFQAIHWDRWTPETAATAQFPAMTTDFIATYQAAGSGFWAIKGDYLRIKSIGLSYKLSDAWARKIGMSGARVYLNGYNIMSWSKTFDKFQLDPEIARFTGARGYQGIYPQQAIFNVGLNLNIL